MGQHEGFDLAQSTRGLTWKNELITSSSATVASSTWKLITYITTDGDEDLNIVSLSDAPGAHMIKIYLVKTLTHANDTVKVVPTNLNGGTQITFAAAGDGCVMCFDGTNWNIIANNGGTIA